MPVVIAVSLGPLIAGARGQFSPWAKPTWQFWVVSRHGCFEDGQLLSDLRLLLGWTHCPRGWDVGVHLDGLAPAKHGRRGRGSRDRDLRLHWHRRARVLGVGRDDECPKQFPVHACAGPNSRTGLLTLDPQVGRNSRSGLRSLMSALPQAPVDRSCAPPPTWRSRHPSQSRAPPPRSRRRYWHSRCNDRSGRTARGGWWRYRARGDGRGCRTP